MSLDARSEFRAHATAPSSPLVVQLAAWLYDLTNASSRLLNVLSMEDHLLGHDDLLQAVRGLKDMPNFEELDTRTRSQLWDRLAALARRQQLELTAYSGRALFADALRVACEALSNPEKPSTIHVAYFVAMFELRRHYNVRFDAPTYRRVRGSYERIRKHTLRSQRSVTLVQEPTDHLLIDALCLGGWLTRGGKAAAAPCYADFARNPFGVDYRGRLRPCYSHGDLTLTLLGELPTFSELTNFVFGQPTGVAGLDAVTGGFLAPIGHSRTGLGTGLISLIAGPPGSGKTNLSLAVSYRMAELGSSVRFLTVEEQPASLIPRVLTAESVLGSDFAPFVASDDQRADFQFTQPLDGETLEDVIARIVPHFRGEATGRRSAEIVLPLQFVVVIDSLTTLLERGGDSDGGRPVLSRKEVADLLERLRRKNVCVILVGSETDPTHAGLAYLVDNVISLGLEIDEISGHTRRFITIQKTRLQRSAVGRHPFRITGTMSCEVSPSLSALLAIVENRDFRVPSATRIKVLLSGSEQLRLADILTEGQPIVIRDGAQVLVYGHGSAGKALFALALAFEPAVSREPADEYAAHLRRRYGGPDEIKLLGASEVDRTRVLVVSFLYGKSYYEKHASSVLEKRFDLPRREASGRLRRQLEVVVVPPGFIDAESVIAMIDERLRRAELEGRPFASIVIDGIHNLLVQFPRLEQEVLFIPTLLRVLRTRPVTVISTFTEFSVARLNPAGSGQEGLQIPPGVRYDRRDADDILVSRELMYHLLVSGLDYTLLVERAPAGWDAPNESSVRVQIVQTLDPTEQQGRGYWWDLSRMRPV